MKDRVLDFWFNELQPMDWYKKNTELDNQILERFTDIHQQAIRGELFYWRDSIDGRLAEIIILDQFSRNMFRGNKQAFEYDVLALALSQEASSLKAAKELAPVKRAFLYMPYMHSESLVIHEKAIKLFSEKGLENNLEFEMKHKVIIEKFGRYPHRNEILGRESTPLELEFLKTPDSGF